MKLYLAGVPGGGWVKREREVLELWDKRLWSYHWIMSGEGTELVKIYLAGAQVTDQLGIESVVSVGRERGRKII